MQTDSLFYRLFQEQPGLVFDLAGWPLPAGVLYRQRERGAGAAGGAGRTG